MSAPDDARRRAKRLVAIYPPAWRARYGEEFTELLVDDFEERPRSWRRTADVVAVATLARLGIAGTATVALEPSERARASVARLGYALAAFLSFGVALWSQVVIGWRWEPPATVPVAVGMVTMSAATLVLAVLVTAAAAPLVWAWTRAVLRRQATGLLRPCLASTVGSAVLIGGGKHFESHWPGTGGHHWAYHNLVPAGVASFAWAVTRGVSTHWMHPGALGRFPTADIAWMAVSPVAILCVVVGVTTTVRHLQLAPAALRYEANLARAAVTVMGVFAAGAGTWVLADTTPGPTGIYQVGAIDVVVLAVMGVALIAANRAAVTARAAAIALARAGSGAGAQAP